MPPWGTGPSLANGPRAVNAGDGGTGPVWRRAPWVTLPARRARTMHGEAHSPVAERPLFLSAAPRLATLARAHESRIQENVHEVGRHRHAVSENVVRSVVVHPSPLVASRVVGERQLGTMTAVDRVVLLVTALPNAL